MLDKFIKERADLVSYSQAELCNISDSVTQLKAILNNQHDLQGPFLGGSYKRGTIVKDVSDVDVYFYYTGADDPKSILIRLKACIADRYPKTYIRQDQPSVMFNFETIPFKITIYKKDDFGNMSISDDFLLNWRIINFGKLEESVVALRRRNTRFIDLIKILKLWNFNHQRGLMNGDIEDRVCKLFLNSKEASADYDLPDMMWTFFNHNKFQPVANRLFSMMTKKGNEAAVKSEWLKFIDNK